MLRKSTETASEKERHRDDLLWRSIYFAAAISFVQSFQSSILTASLWPYSKTLVPSLTENAFGYILASSHVAQCISSPVFGWWSNQSGNMKLPVICGLTSMIFGNVLYSSMHLFTDNHFIWILCTRFISGIGSGNTALLRAYVSTVSSSKNRAKAIAYITGGDTLASVIGPAIQSLFTPLTASGVSILGFNITIFNAPSILSVFVLLIGLFLTIVMFDGTQNSVKTEELLSPDHLRLDYFAVLVCVLTRFSLAIMMLNLGSLMSNYSMLMFNWDKEVAVLYNSLLKGVQGVFMLIVYMSFIFMNLQKWLNMRLTSLVCLLIFILFHLVEYPWSFLPDKVAIYNSKTSNHSGGCDSATYSWCSDLPAVSVWNFVPLNVFVVGFIFSLFNISLTTTYSYVLGQRKQGVLQGIFQVFGAFGNSIGPIVLGSVYESHGPRALYSIEIVQLLVISILWVLSWRRLSPDKERVEFLKLSNMSIYTVSEKNSASLLKM